MLSESSDDSSVVVLDMSSRFGVGTALARAFSSAKKGSMTFRKLLTPGLGSAAWVFTLLTPSGRGGGALGSDVDFFRRLKNEDGFLVSVGGG